VLLLRLLDSIESRTTAASAHTLLRVLMRSPIFASSSTASSSSLSGDTLSSAAAGADALTHELRAMGFEGLWDWCSAKGGCAHVREGGVTGGIGGTAAAIAAAARNKGKEKVELYVVTDRLIEACFM
jgi:hypothetical protein